MNSETTQMELDAARWRYVRGEGVMWFTGAHQWRSLYRADMECDRARGKAGSGVIDAADRTLAGIARALRAGHFEKGELAAYADILESFSSDAEEVNCRGIVENAPQVDESIGTD